MKGLITMPEYLVIIQYDDRFQYMAFKKFEIAHTYFFSDDGYNRFRRRKDYTNVIV